MDKYFNYPVGVIAAVLANLWLRGILFVAACCGGATLASFIRPKEYLDGAALVLFAPILWIASPITLLANLLTIILIVALVRSETTLGAAGCFVGAALVWFGHGMLIWT